MAPERSVHVVIPVKGLADSKSRLSPVMDSRERAELVVALLKDVVRAVKKSSVVSRTVVISPDRNFLRIAHELGVDTILESRPGLNEALTQATDWCIDRGADSVLILPSDIPLTTSEDVSGLIDLCDSPRCVVISPSEDGGTNALLRQPPEIIPPSFGYDSFKRHLNKAEARGVEVRVYRSPRVSMDIDSIEDLKRFLESPSETETYRLLREMGFQDKLV